MMSVMAYVLVGSPLKLDFAAMSREQLKEYRARFESIAGDRVEALKAEVRATSGYEHWQADLSLRSLDLLATWMASNVEITPETIGTTKPIALSGNVVDVSAEELTPRSYSIATDVGFYLLFVTLNGNKALYLHQDIKTQRHVEYGHVVVAGFPKNLVMNPIRITTNICYRIVQGEEDAHALRQTYEKWQSMK